MEEKKLNEVRREAENFASHVRHQSRAGMNFVSFRTAQAMAAVDYIAHLEGNNRTLVESAQVSEAIAGFTATQSQAVPSELASLQTVAVMVPNGRYHSYPAMTSEGSVCCKVGDQLVKLSDVQSLFSHSAATGKVREAVLERVARAICSACHENPDHNGDARGNEKRWMDYLEVADAAMLAASPAAPLAGKAEPVAWMAEGQLFANTDCIPPRLLPPLGNPVPLYTAPLAAVPAEEASETERMARLGRYVTRFATKGGWDASEGEGAFEFVQCQCYQAGWNDAKSRALKSAAPTAEGEKK